jgi:hypothetical protein
MDFSWGTLLAAEGDPKQNNFITDAEKVPAAERCEPLERPMQHQLRVHKQILYDLVLNHLEPLPGTFSRLAYLAGLRNPATENYAEKGLCEAYGEEPVHQALMECHEELFERTLELSLTQQQEELFQFFKAQSGGFPGNTQQCKELLDSWIPQQAPGYLKELFRSNLHVLCELLHEQQSKARSDR